MALEKNQFLDWKCQWVYSIMTTNCNIFHDMNRCGKLKNKGWTGYKSKIMHTQMKNAFRINLDSK